MLKLQQINDGTNYIEDWPCPDCVYPDLSPFQIRVYESKIENQERHKNCEEDHAEGIVSAY
jgi:hypothetical protein